MALVRDQIIASQGLVIDTFRGFRDELLGSYGNIEFTLKTDNSQVTELDIRVETVLREKLQMAFPELGFQGEETGVSEQRASYWLVDPIDGTSSFIRGLPNCTNMAALIDDGDVVATVIYDFVHDVLYTALRGEGAYRDGQRLSVAQRPIGRSAVYIDSFKIDDELKQAFIEQRVGVYRPLGASGRAFVSVAEGKIDAYSLINSPASAHDTAPGILLVQEAGGQLVTRGDRPWEVDMTDFVIAAPPIAELFRQHMHEDSTGKL